MIVLDASVVIKWVFHDEDGADRAGRFKDAHVAGDDIVAVPDLFFFEAANVLATRTRLIEEDCAEALGLLWRMELEQFDFGLREFTRALHLAKRQGISVYDAAYLELSRELGCRFITADRKLYAKVKGFKHVALL